MSFEEKSTALMLAILVAVYGWYFGTVVGQLGTTSVGDIDYRGMVIVTVVAVVVLAIIGHIILAVVPSGDGMDSDERDKEVDLRGEWIGGFVLGALSLVGLVLALVEAEHFWIANAILLGMVLSQVASSVAKLVYYRRMA